MDDVGGWFFFFFDVFWLVCLVFLFKSLFSYFLVEGLFRIFGVGLLIVRIDDVRVFMGVIERVVFGYCGILEDKNFWYINVLDGEMDDLSDEVVFLERIFDDCDSLVGVGFLFCWWLWYIIGVRDFRMSVGFFFSFCVSIDDMDDWNVIVVILDGENGL